MSRWGIGPVFASLSIIYAMIMTAIGFHFRPAFEIQFIQYKYLIIFGIGLITIGIPFFIVSFISLSRAYNTKQFVTSGIFRCCRNPIYAAWTVFIVPGITILLHNWLALTTPIFMYLILRILVVKEEKYLEKTFGSKFLD